MLQPIKVTCADHEGTRAGRIQQWDGKKWNVISDWYHVRRQGDQADGRGTAAKKYADEKKHHAARLLQGELKTSALAHSASRRLQTLTSPVIRGRQGGGSPNRDASSYRSELANIVLLLAPSLPSPV